MTQPLSLVMMDLSWLEIKSYSVRKMEPGMALPQSARLVLVSKNVAKLYCECIAYAVTVKFEPTAYTATEGEDNEVELIIRAENVMKSVEFDITLQSQTAQGMSNRAKSSIVVQQALFFSQLALTSWQLPVW